MFGAYGNQRDRQRASGWRSRRVGQAVVIFRTSRAAPGRGAAEAP